MWPEPNLVAWHMKPSSLPWPVALLSRTETEGMWNIRRFNAAHPHMTASEEVLLDFAENAYLAFKGTITSSMATACADALEFVRRHGTHKQRRTLCAPEFVSFVSSLEKICVEESVTRLPNVVTEEILKAKKHLASCDASVREQKGIIQKIVDVRQELSIKVKDKAQKSSHLEEEVRRIEQKLVQIEKERATLAAELEKCEGKLKSATTQLECHVMNQRGARAYLRQLTTEKQGRTLKTTVLDEAESVKVEETFAETRKGDSFKSFVHGRHRLGMSRTSSFQTEGPERSPSNQGRESTTSVPTDSADLRGNIGKREYKDPTRKCELKAPSEHKKEQQIPAWTETSRLRKRSRFSSIEEEIIEEGQGAK